MNSAAIKSIENYSRHVTEAINRRTIQHSTVTVFSNSPYTGIAEGEIFFLQGFRLKIHEEVDFADGLITSYGYEVYHEENRLYWYDDFPHPNDPALTSSFPHHKHIPPNIKRHRLPSPEITYKRSNLLRLIQDIEVLIEEKT